MIYNRGGAVESLAVQAALKLAADFAYSPMAGLVDLKTIDVSSTGVLTVKTGQVEREVIFALRIWINNLPLARGA